MLVLAIFQTLRILDDPFDSLTQVPATMDLRELGLVTIPKDVSFIGCGSGAAAVASLIESSILRTLDKWQNNAKLIGKTTDNLEVSVQFMMNNSQVYSANKGFYCTQPAEYIINDIGDWNSIQLNIDPFKYTSGSTQFNPEPDFIIKINPGLYSEAINSPNEFIQPFYKDQSNNILVLSYHTPFFSLSGDEPFGQDTVDNMKQYIARGITFIAQINLGTDRQYQQFRQWNTSDVFAAQCLRVSPKFQTPSYENIKEDIVKNGYNKLQERIFYVNIVGYGIKQGQDVWIVKAPFGPKFGNLGYIYVPILNNTLCMEEYIITAIPNHIDFDEGIFTSQQADRIGLKQIYSIKGLISKSLPDDTAGDIVTTDLYSDKPNFGVNPQLISKLTATPVSTLLGSILTCVVEESFDGNIAFQDQQCTTVLRMIKDSWTSSVTISYPSRCFFASDIVTTCADGNCKINSKSDTGTSTFTCIVGQPILTEQGLSIEDYRATIVVKDVCIWSSGVMSCVVVSADPSTVQLVTYQKSTGEDFQPSAINSLQYIPGPILCSDSICTREMLDTIANLLQVWTCSKGSNVYTCVGQQENIQRPNIKFYGEVKQLTSQCSAVGSNSICPPSYNMNFTTARIRLNATNTYDLGGILYPIMFINIRPDSISKDYLWLLNITFPEIETRTYVDVVFPDFKTRKIEAACMAQFKTKDDSQYILQCRNYNNQADFYVCENIQWLCTSPLYGWTKSLTLNYSLNFSSQMPVILQAPKAVSHSRQQWTITYQKLKYDVMNVVVSGIDPENFAFSPCKVSNSLNSSVCRNFEIPNVKLTCLLTTCSPIKSLQFEFSHITNHIMFGNLPQFQSTSTFYCKFISQLGCRINRQNLKQYGFICDQGEIYCDGVSTSTYTYYSQQGAAVQTKSGTSIFVFNSTNFTCTVNTIKSFRDSDDNIWANLLCSVNNSQTTFSTVSNSPDYLVRDSNSIDDVPGMIPIKQNDIGLQVIFAVGLIFIVLLIISVSALLSGWPGLVKSKFTAFWNKIVWNEKYKFSCIYYDKFGIPMLDLDEPEAHSAKLDMHKVSKAMKSGFDGLSIAKLKDALHNQEVKLADGKVQVGQSTMNSQLTTQFNSMTTKTMSQLNCDEEEIGARDADDIQVIFKKKRQEKLRNDDWEDSN
ncbi:Cathepsin L [Spironucleus salmonicida]|uniref:Cathepsin L n=1 Tax=Spironucleus salmonicida TaxID=348837 RepID=V6LBC1_9EUKA|nr:Cathepsin L [Spironucleus salmonicida]|eukprot:EST41697.1 Cathepsin L [Spironucleus salmonicida]